MRRRVLGATGTAGRSHEAAAAAAAAADVGRIAVGKKKKLQSRESMHRCETLMQTYRMTPDSRTPKVCLLNTEGSDVPRSLRFIL